MTITERLIAECGFDGLRLRDVSDAAGVSIGMIQHYFATRDDLIQATLSRASWRRAAEWASLADGIDDPVKRTRVLLAGSVADRVRCQGWMETCSSSTRHGELIPVINRIYDAWRQALHDSLETGVKAGVFAPVVPMDQLLDTIMAMIDGLMVSVGLQFQGFDNAYVSLLLEDVAGRLLGFDFSGTRPST